MLALRSAAERAEAYTTPLNDPDNRTSDSNDIISLLARKNDHLTTDNVAQRCLLESLERLDDIHRAAVSDGFSPSTTYDNTLMSTIYLLVDLIANQWLLPCLSPGVAFPHRPKSVLTIPVTKFNHDRRFCLSNIAKTVLRLVEKENVGIAPIISQRFLPDLVSAVGELAFAPDLSDAEQPQRAQSFVELLNRTSTSRLLPLLTTYVCQPLPSWLRPHVAQPLSILPLRPRGIRHIIEYITVSHQSDQKASDMQQTGTIGPPITLTAIQQASTLVCAPPRSMNIEKWIALIAPQLLEMLDGTEGPDLVRAAGHIISSGFLSKRSTGSPGAPGWSAFARPILDLLNPPMQGFSVGKSGVIVPSADLSKALGRLDAIVSSFPNPGVAKRLIGPLKLSLWAMFNYAKAPREKVFIREKWSAVSRSLLKRYLELTADSSQMDDIALNLLYDGAPQWTFIPGEDGGIDLCVREEAKQDVAAVLERLQNVDRRSEVFVKLLIDSKLNEDIVSSVFLSIARRWLTPMTSNPAGINADDGYGMNAFQTLINAKLAQALLTYAQAKLTQKPLQIIQLLDQVLSQFVEKVRLRKQRLNSLQKPTIASLAQIVKHGDDLGDSSKLPAETEDEDLAITSLSILNHFLSTNVESSGEMNATLNRISSSLRYIAAPGQGLSSELQDQATKILGLIANSPDVSTSEPSISNDFQMKWQSIVHNISAKEAPIRASAIAELSNLMDLDRATELDVAQTTHLLVHVIQTDRDSYVYLPAMKALVKFCSKQGRPHFTIRIALDAFLDAEESTNASLEGRLRLGEAIDLLIKDALDPQSISSAESTRFAVSSVAEFCLKLASRRGHRPKNLAARETASINAAVKLKAERKEALEAWGGEAPEIDQALLDPDFEPETQQQRLEREYLEAMVRGWEDTGVEEDVRIRMSALSVLGSLLEKFLSPEDLAKEMISAIDICLSVVVLETQSGHIILRRAAVMTVMSILRAVDELLEEKEMTSADDLLKIGNKKWPEVDRVMRWISSEDRDEIVRDHAEAVVEGLEILKIKRVAQNNGAEGVQYEIPNALQGGLRGLRVEGTPGTNTVDQRSQKSALVEEVD